MEAPFLIRHATPADATLLAGLGARTFLEAFADSNSEEDLRLFMASTYREDIQASELADPTALYLVLEAKGEAVGFARIRTGEVPDCIEGPGPIELQRIYVLKAWLGLKAGPALLDRCLEEARLWGGRTLWLGVWEHNDRAQAFYRRHGFQEVGDHAFLVGTDSQRDVIMVRPL